MKHVADQDACQPRTVLGPAIRDLRGKTALRLRRSPLIYLRLLRRFILHLQLVTKEEESPLALKVVIMNAEE